MVFCILLFKLTSESFCLLNLPLTFHIRTNWGLCRQRALSHYFLGAQSQFNCIASVWLVRRTSVYKIIPPPTERVISAHLLTSCELGSIILWIITKCVAENWVWIINYLHRCGDCSGFKMLSLKTMTTGFWAESKAEGSPWSARTFPVPIAQGRSGSPADSGLPQPSRDYGSGLSRNAWLLCPVLGFVSKSFLKTWSDVVENHTADVWWTIMPCIKLGLPGRIKSCP